MSDHAHNRDGDAPAPPSNRSFGLVMGGFFLLVAAAPLFSRRPVRGWSLAVSLAFLAAAVVQPKLLAWPNRLWHRLGLLMHAVVSPLVLGFIYFAVITPIGKLMVWRKGDPMRRAFDPAAPTYWINREPPGPAPGSMSRQF